MGREVRRVAANWEHPKDEDGCHIPLLKRRFYDDESGDDETEFMPNWSDDERTHYQWYEDTTEGTPLSPPFATKAELVDYIVKTGDPVYGAITREQAENFVEEEWAPTFVSTPETGLIGGMQWTPDDQGK